jgi:hypothetical protein
VATLVTWQLRCWRLRPWLVIISTVLLKNPHSAQCVH